MSQPPRASDDPLSQTLYDELRAAARGAMSKERREHTLQPTALVHEAMIRLSSQRTAWRNRSHFLAVAAQMMRRVLLDHARRRSADKRPEGQVRVTLSGLEEAEQGVDVADLHEALQRLEQLDPRAARVVELRGLVGCTMPEAAEVLGISVATVERDWRMGRTWLRRELLPAP